MDVLRGKFPALAFGLACAVGWLARLWNLGPQILGGDELHAVRAALRDSPWTLLTTFGARDHCIPLALLFRALAGAGVTLDEWTMRLLPLLAGCTLVVLLPRALAARGLAGQVPPILLAGLLALSPPLVLYSRIVRSYAPMVLLVTLAVLALERFWATGARRAAAGYALAGGAAIWFHLGAAPAVAAPLLVLVAAGGSRLDRRGGDGAGGAVGPRWWWPAGMVVAVTGMLLLPAASSLLTLIGAKRAPQAATLEAFAHAAQLQAGARLPAVAGVILGLAALGWVALWRGAPRWAWLSAAVVLGQVVGLLVLSPTGLDRAVVVNRYLLPATPWLLVWVAAGLASLAGWAARRWPGLRRGLPVAAAAAILAWSLAGPLAEARFTRSVFGHSTEAMSYFRDWRPPETLPAAYSWWLGTADEDDVTVEAPFLDRWWLFREIPRRQLAHRRRLRVADAQPLAARAAVRLRNTVPATAAGVAGAGADFVILHRDLLAEAGSGVIEPDGELAAAGTEGSEAGPTAPGPRGRGPRRAPWRATCGGAGGRHRSPTTASWSGTSGVGEAAAGAARDRTPGREPVEG